MKTIKIAVTGNLAQVTEGSTVVTGTVGLPVEFAFDNVWKDLHKTVVFRVNGKSMDCVNITDVVTVPWELLETPGCRLFAGVYGTNADGSLQIPTVWADLGVIQPGADPSGDESADPSLPVWAQVKKENLQYTPQDLTEEQKAQARKNIDAAYINPAGGILHLRDEDGDVSIYMQAAESDEFNLFLFGGENKDYVRISGVADGINSGDAATVGQLNGMIKKINFFLDDRFIGDSDGKKRAGFITRDMSSTQMFAFLKYGGILVGLFTPREGGQPVFTAMGRMDDGFNNESGCREIIFHNYSHIYDNRLIREGTAGGAGNELWICYPLD